MCEDSLERDTRALLVQLLHEHFGSQVELVDTTAVLQRFTREDDEREGSLLVALRQPVRTGWQ
jgi:hypothetical protein